MPCTAIVVAAGKSERFGAIIPKPFVEVAGKPILGWTLGQFEKAECINEIVLVVATDFLPMAADLVSSIAAVKVRKIVSGGATRTASVRLGLEAAPKSTTLVAIHDGARPLIAVEDIIRVVEVGGQTGAAILAARCTDALKVVRGSIIERTLEKECHFLAQTPQVFDYQLILESHQRPGADLSAADDAILLEQAGVKVTVVEPKFPNPKITYSHDVIMLEALLARGKHV